MAYLGGWGHQGMRLGHRHDGDQRVALTLLLLCFPRVHLQYWRNIGSREYKTHIRKLLGRYDWQLGTNIATMIGEGGSFHTCSQAGLVHKRFQHCSLLRGDRGWASSGECRRTAWSA